jgi:hypothetical protein
VNEPPATCHRNDLEGAAAMTTDTLTRNDNAQPRLAVDFTVDTGASSTDLVFVLPLSSRAQHFARIMFPARGTRWLGTWLFQGRHAEVELRRLERLNYRLRINGAMGGN